MPEMLVETQRLVEKQDQITIKPEGLPAKVNVVTKEDLKRKPYTGTYFDLLKDVPGVRMMRAVQMGDFGNITGMRGFFQRDAVAIFMDGMPLNTLYNPHGQPQIGWIVPEMIERIEVIKGPFSALYGDFALAGVINFVTKKSDPSPSLGGFGGTYDTYRGVGVISDPGWGKSLRNVTPFLVWEGYARHGYRDNERYRRGQFFNKFTFPIWQGDLSVRGHYAARTWGSAGFLSIAEMKAGKVNRKDAVDLDDGGSGEMANFVVNYSPKGGEEGLHASLYYAYLWQDFKVNSSGTTYAYNSTFNYCGWRLLYDYRPLKQLSLIAGNELRYDNNRSNYSTGIQYSNIMKLMQSYDYEQFNTGFFVQGQYKPFSFFKLVGGVRYDIFNIDVDNKLYLQNSGNGSPNMWSPKIGVVITPYKDINIFANKGRGFRSPSVSELSPSSANQKANFDLGLAKLDTWDVGINALLFKRLFISFDYYNTLYQREVTFNSATNLYENLGASKRTGIEVEAKIFLTKELTVYGSWTDVRARLKNPTTPGGYYIPNLPEDMATVGLEFQKPWGGGDHQIGFNFYYLRYGRMPVRAKGTVIGSQFDQYMGKLTYRYKKCTFSLDAAFTPRRYAADGYSLIADNHSLLRIAPYPLWEVLGGVKYQF